jgi:hypothetical protein
MWSPLKSFLIKILLQTCALHNLSNLELIIFIVQDKRAHILKTFVMFSTLFPFSFLSRFSLSNIVNFRLFFRVRDKVSHANKETGTITTPWSTFLLQNLTVAQLVKNKANFMETESSLPRSQDPNIWPYPPPTESRPLVLKLYYFFKTHFSIPPPPRCTPTSPNWYLPFRFSNYNIVRTVRLSHNAYSCNYNAKFLTNTLCDYATFLKHE